MESVRIRVSVPGSRSKNDYFDIPGYGVLSRDIPGFYMLHLYIFKTSISYIFPCIFMEVLQVCHTYN